MKFTVKNNLIFIKIAAASLILITLILPLQAQTKIPIEIINQQKGSFQITDLGLDGTKKSLKTDGKYCLEVDKQSIKNNFKLYANFKLLFQVLGNQNKSSFSFGFKLPKEPVNKSEFIYDDSAIYNSYKLYDDQTGGVSYFTRWQVKVLACYGPHPTTLGGYSLPDKLKLQIKLITNGFVDGDTEL